ncbi:hypothetical protein Mal65_31720 [Crateriforma conspicua]|nr:hypothetical protein Mal65_31720 [Crateriforma conspicua]
MQVVSPRRGQPGAAADPSTSCDRKKTQQLQRELHSLRAELEHYRSLATPSDPVAALPNDRPLRGHQFGVRLIALCIELAKRVGFRATAFVVKLMFEFLGVDQKVPSHDAIAQWTMRLGVAELAETFDSTQEVLWMADHSSQIGKEKVLLIIGMRVDDLPPPGETLDLEKLKVLAIVPGEKWKKEDVDREYQRLAEKIGPPVYLLCDGAVELRDPAKNLVKDGKQAIVLQDLKHHAANLLEKQVGRSERFKAFMTQVGLTRNRVQQTELSHFMPPPLKQKSRFMNLGSLLRWSTMVMHHLNHPESDSRAGVTEERIDEKLGWLRDFADDLAQWNQCQEVINETLSWINQSGLRCDSTAELRDLLASWLELPSGQSGRQMAEKLVDFVAASEQQLPAGSRAWLSTEILESLFGRFKQLERQHSKGGFTRLLACLPTLCRRVTADRVRSRFKHVQAGDVQQWIRDTLPNTLTARRNAAYREAFAHQ